MSNAITPGICELVNRLNECGFETTDSGDGITNVEAGMEGVLEIPHVHMLTIPETLIADARRLHRCLMDWGVTGDIQATYSPIDGAAILSLYGVSDKDLK